MSKHELVRASKDDAAPEDALTEFDEPPPHAAMSPAQRGYDAWAKRQALMSRTNVS